MFPVSVIVRGGYIFLLLFATPANLKFKPPLDCQDLDPDSEILLHHLKNLQSKAFPISLGIK